MTFVLKLDHQGDIRRSVCSAAYSLRELVAQAQSAWLLSLPSFSYVDNDGDSISIVTSLDWKAAVEFGVSQGLLRVKVSRDGRLVVLDDNSAAAAGSSSSPSSVATVPVSEPADTATQAVQLYEEGKDGELVALLERETAASAQHDVVLLLLLRLTYRTWPASLANRVHAVDPIKALLERARQAGAEAHTAAEAYLRRKHAAHGDNSTWALLAAVLFDVVLQAPETAVVFLREAIERGGRAAAPARSQLGILYETGQGVYSNVSHALELFRQGAEAGDPASLTNYARLLPPGSEERAQAVRRAADTKLSAAVYNLALETTDQAESAQLLEQAARLGLDVAQYELGIRTRAGTHGITANDLEAVSWLVNAADQGLREAKHVLGSVYLEGASDVIEKSPVEAVRYFTEAAELGLPDAQYMLGTLYDGGLDDVLTQSAEQAFAWYMRAAVAGHKAAQLEVGSMYSEGRGVAASEAEAAKWFTIATGDAAPAQEASLAESRQVASHSTPELPHAAGFDDGEQQQQHQQQQLSQQELRARLVEGGFVGTYYQWSSADGGASWEPSAARFTVDADGNLSLATAGGADAPQRLEAQLSLSVVDESAIDVVFTSEHVHGEVTFVAGAVESNVIWGEDLSKDSKLFSGWVEVRGDVRTVVRGIRDDPTSFEFRALVPEAASLEQSLVSSVVTSAHLATLKDSLLAFERFLIRAAVHWNETADERRHWVRTVKLAEFGSHLAASLLQLIANTDTAYIAEHVREQHRPVLTRPEVTVREVAEALLALEISTPWSAVVPIFRTYRAGWVDGLRQIVDEPVAEMQQTLHASILSASRGPAAARAAPPVVVSPNHTPLYTLPLGLKARDVLSFKAQLQSTANENLLFRINLYGATPGQPDLQLSFRRSAGDAGLVTLHDNLRHASEVVAAEGQPFPPIAEDFDVRISFHDDRTITVAIEPLGILHTSAPLDFITLDDVTRVQLEAPHGRVLVRSVDHSYSRTTALHPGA